LWAGFAALVNQQAAISGKPPIGFINPAVYEIANQSNYKLAFNDITNGNNTSPSSPTAFYAVPGYDLCTGIGTPRGTTLINALANPDPLTVVSNAGFYAVGTPAGTFNVASQVFYVTNAGTAPLVWSLVNTSAWLDVSNSGGTLAAGAGDTVVVSLNTVASNLLAGTYKANLSFSNVTSHVGHYRAFTVKPTDPLAILPSSKFTISGPPGGPFVPAARSITLTNPSAASLNWGINNTSAWYVVSPTSGTLLPGDQTGVTFTPTPAATALGDGIYKTVFQLTNLTSQFVQAVTGTLSVGLLQNGGFETGDFSNWSLVGNPNVGGTLYNGVVDANSLIDGSGPSFIHSGTYGAFLGDTNLATLSQTIQTTPGQSYLLSFWLDNPISGADQQFMVNWNTNNSSINQIYALNNPPVMPWTLVTFSLNATETNTTLQFVTQNPPNGFGLDDISVVAIAPPAFTSQPTNLTILAGNTASFSATANGTAPLVYGWRKNGINLANGLGISGATSPSLALTGVTTNSAGDYTLVITNVYGSATSSVATLTVVLPPTITGVVANPNGTVTLGLAGSPGVSYILEGNTNITSAAGWQPIATNVMDLTGVWSFNDLQATNFPQLFYRLKYSP